MSGIAAQYSRADLRIGRDVAVPLHLDLAGDAGGAQALRLADREPVAHAEFGAAEPALGLKAREPGFSFGDYTARKFRAN